jgi:hypothetical protein
MEMDLLVYKTVNSVVNVPVVLPVDRTSGYEPLSILLVRVSEQPHKVLRSTDVNLVDVLSVQDRHDIENRITSSDPMEDTREYAAQDGGSAGAHTSAAMLSILTAFARGHSEYSTKASVTIVDQTVETFADSDDFICRVMQAKFEELATKLRIHVQTDGRTCLGVVTRTYRGKLAVKVRKSRARGGSGAVNSVDETAAEVGRDSKSGP